MKRTPLLVCLLALCNPILFAQTTKGPQIVRIPKRSAIHVPPQEVPAGLKKIYSNLGPKSDPYDYNSGWLLSGPNSTYGNSVFFGLPFTPKSNSHVSQVQVALQYASGANQVNVSIYGDSGGAPGTLLAGPVTVVNLPVQGTCCPLAVASFFPVAVTGGTRYWVVADTPLTGTGSDFNGDWGMIVKPVILMATNFDSGGWTGFNADQLVAGAVLGTIP